MQCRRHLTRYVQGSDTNQLIAPRCRQTFDTFKILLINAFKSKDQRPVWYSQDLTSTKTELHTVCISIRNTTSNPYMSNVTR